ncbi:MAG: aspartate carbamoyltransferase regulatory subunit [Eubacteriales bacterium]|jgi:aspartate carbamoyltransferase regulatory subunit|nr:aspartate carbamoyltransferase regulatory subunit [Eubacteriales bacterium]MDD3572792.1 aspartate carbamoyltransferase regulatory subunit [Eubacteriales bacterium]
MNIDAIKNGLVIDHIKAGQGMKVYDFLDLGKLDCSVAIIQNATSSKMGIKDIIKIDSALDVDLNALGYIDPNITINVIQDSVRVKKYHPELPETITNIIRCRNPRCITSTEQQLPHVFKLADRQKDEYRCLYCESKAAR